MPHVIVADTAFYILGGALVVIALLLTAVGLRWQRFPASGAVFAGLLVAVVAVVGATGTFAWINAADEQDKHAAELAEERRAAQEAQARGEEEEVDAAEGEQAAGPDGAQLFDDQGCGGCHALEAAGTTAETGPNLDGALPGKSAEEIETSIVDPNAEIAEGFPPNVMPPDFGDRLSPEELEALVEFLRESTGDQS